MKVALFFIRIWFSILSRIAPEKAAQQAADLFQRPQKRPFRAPEKLFYQQQPSEEIAYEEGTYHRYEWGNPNGQLVLLAHGWNSNAGSMAGIGNRLANLGYRVVAIDLPGHGRTQRSHTNLVWMSAALQHLMLSLAGTPFSVVAHSMGSAVTSLALQRTGLEAHQLVFLTSPNTMRAIFADYQRQIGLGQRAYDRLIHMVEDLLDVEIDQVTVAKLLHSAPYDELLIVHDRRDRVIPFDNAVEIVAQTLNSRYLPLEQTGHYRMLWMPEVLDIVEDELEGHLAPRYAFASLDYRN